jgi:hypothetical protein
MFRANYSPNIGKSATGVDTSLKCITALFLFGITSLASSAICFAQSGILTLDSLEVSKKEQAPASLEENQIPLVKPVV